LIDEPEKKKKVEFNQINVPRFVEHHFGSKSNKTIEKKKFKETIKRKETF